jgi:hypothetical protein
LAEVRNRAMDPLEQFKDPSQWFDHVVFMNDVMFCAKDIKCVLLSSSPYLPSITTRLRSSAQGMCQKLEFQLV